MDMGAAELLSEIRRLSSAEQLELVSDVWDELVRSDAVPVPNWHVEEIHRRLADDSSEAISGKPWASVKKEILNQ